MAVNVCITAHEMRLDEINGEAEADQWTDDPESLRRTVGQLAGIATSLSELLEIAEDEQRWYRDHPVRTTIGDIRGLLTLPFRRWREARRG